jgi:glycine/D-amino acid oxidase-like deaminating enzyme
VKQIPFWVDDFPRPEGLTGNLQKQTDYLVVGSGYTGLSAARRLASAGKDVLVIDAGEIAGGASSMNGGIVSPDVKAGVDSVFATYGPKVAAEMWASTVRATELVEEFAGRPDVDAITHRGGMAALGRGARQLKAFDRDVAWYKKRFAVDWYVVDAGDIHTVVGGDSFNVAMIEPEGFGVHPARLAFRLAEEVQKLGAVIVDNCVALAMSKTTNGLRVETSKGTTEAGDVILATNGYTTPQPSKELARLVVPVGSYMIATEPLDEGVAESVFPGGVVAWHRKRLLNYMRRTHDDRIVIGGRRSLHTDLDLDESAADLRSTLIRHWPVLTNAEITHVWGGQLAVPFDLTPHIGRVDGAWYATGYAGHGVALSNGLGHELAGMLLGEDPPSIYTKIEHKGRFYHTGARPWFLTPASVLYRGLDRLGM